MNAEQQKKTKRLEKMRKKAAQKLAEYQKKIEEFRFKSEKKAKEYANIEQQLIIASKPQVGDPVFPDTGLSPRKENREEVPLSAKEEERLKKRAQREQEEFEKAEKRRIARGDFTMYERFEALSFEEAEELLRNAKEREERAFYRTVLNLKLQIEQEKVIGEELV